MAIKYIIDTCTISHLLEGRETVVRRINELPRSQTYITPITISEAYYGILTIPKIKSNEVDEIMLAIHSFPVLPITETVAFRHAKLKAASKETGCKKDNDMWIIAFCDDEEATLITTDSRMGHLSKFTNCLEIIQI
ncbi:MAG: hypothetical protein JWM56_753 [Candidatus Peribacteria bacterium]|nr:hypothetical protein [Candidatus Peribacteria bacterium]